MLIKLVEQDMALNRPNHEQPFELEVDASQFAIGVILFQCTPDRLPHPISYYSHALTAAECSYDVHDRELLTVILGLKRWQHLLLRAKHLIKVYTDHKNLQYYRSPHDINRRVARYLPFMMEFNIILIYKPGKTMKADPLSRRPDFDTGENDNKQVVVLPSQLFATISSLTTTELSTRENRLLQAQFDRPTKISTWQKPHGLT
jgi:RNase H-like domain found in reverse transcriptase